MPNDAIRNHDESHEANEAHYDADFVANGRRWGVRGGINAFGRRHVVLDCAFVLFCFLSTWFWPSTGDAGDGSNWIEVD